MSTLDTLSEEFLLENDRDHETTGQESTAVSTIKDMPTAKEAAVQPVPKTEVVDPPAAAVTSSRSTPTKEAQLVLPDFLQPRRTPSAVVPSENASTSSEQVTAVTKDKAKDILKEVLPFNPAPQKPEAINNFADPNVLLKLNIKAMEQIEARDKTIGELQMKNNEMECQLNEAYVKHQDITENITSLHFELKSVQAENAKLSEELQQTEIDNNQRLTELIAKHQIEVDKVKEEIHKLKAAGTPDTPKPEHRSNITVLKPLKPTTPEVSKASLSANDLKEKEHPTSQQAKMETPTQQPAPAQVPAVSSQAPKQMTLSPRELEMMKRLQDM